MYKPIPIAFDILALLREEHKAAGCQLPPEFTSCSICEQIEKFDRVLKELQKKE
jgi:hypothetical protein